MNLSDEAEVNSICILKDFKCNVKSKNIELKKIKIKSIIRNPSFKAKSNINPFLSILMRHKKQEWDCLSEKEFFITLNKNIDIIPDYVKLANLIMKYPNEDDKYIKLINENITNNRYLFNFDLTFDSNEEINEYFSKISNGKEDLLNNLTKYFLKAVKMNLLKTDIENLKDIKTWDMLKLYSNIKKDNEADNILLKFQYIKTHDDVDKNILDKFCFDIIFYLLVLFDGSSVDTKELSGLKKEVSKINTDYKILEKLRIEKEKDFKLTIKNLKHELSTINLNVIKFDKIKSETEKLNIETEKISNKNEQLIIQLTDLKTQKNLVDIELKKTKTENKLNFKKRENTKLYYKDNFPTETTEKIFGVIYSTEIDIIKNIFSEVEFIYIDDWKKQIDNVKQVYIQREGIPSRELTRIKKHCINNGVKVIKTISVDNEKKLIEIISMLKNE